MKPSVGALAAAALAAAAYANTLRGALLYDDVPDIVRNRFVRESDLVGIFTEPSWATWVGIGDAGFRPVTTATFALNHVVHGLGPFGYHLVNVALHAAVSALLVIVLARVLARPAVAALAGLLFAAHPVHTEAVASVVGRADVLSALLGLCCWGLVFPRDGRQGRPAWALAGAVSLALAVLAKETAVAMAGVILLADLVGGRRRGDGPGRVLRARWATWALLVFAAAAALAWRSTVLHGSGGGITQFDNVLAREPLFGRVATTLAVAARYVEKLAWPVRLSADYSYRQIELASWSDPYALAGLLLLLGIAVAGVAAHRRAPDACVGLVLLALPLALVLGLTFLALGPTMAERLLYLPSAGFCVLVGLALHQVAVRSRAAQAVAYGTAAALLVGWTVLTVARNRVWQHPAVFFPAMVADAPHSARAHRELGMHHAETRQVDAALAELRASLDILPNPSTAYNLGNVLAGAGRHDEAIAAYRLALSLRPSFAEAMANLATTYHQKGDDESAVVWFQRALAAAPDAAQVHMNFANSLQQLGRLDEAAAHYEEAVAREPRDAAIRFNYGVCLERLGRLEDAVRQFEAAIAADGTWAGPHERLIATRLAMGQRAEALAALARAEHLIPADPTVQKIRRWFDSTPKAR